MRKVFCDQCENEVKDSKLDATGAVGKLINALQSSKIVTEDFCDSKCMFDKLKVEIENAINDIMSGKYVMKPLTKKQTENNGHIFNQLDDESESKYTGYFKVGERVLLVDLEWGGGTYTAGPMNPMIDTEHECEGTIDDISGDGSILVKWSNGNLGVYKDSNLQKVIKK